MGIIVIRGESKLDTASISGTSAARSNFLATALPPIGAIITESIYSVGGMGKMLPNAINQYNNVMIVALAFIFSTVSVLSVLAGDIVLTKVDPRISLSEKAGRS